MTITFAGAGPGSADLIPLRTLKHLQSCDLCLYAGSLVSPEIIEHVPKEASTIDSAPLTLERIIEIMAQAHEEGQKIVRLHSGDPSVYGAIHEQMHRLDKLNIPYDIIPGITSLSAAAALLKCEWTVPNGPQSVIITRVDGKSSPMRPQENLDHLAASHATLGIHLSIRFIRRIVTTLIPHYGEDCPCAVLYRIGWSDQKILRAPLSDIAAHVRAAKITRTALIIVGEALQPNHGESALYHRDHHHLFRSTRLSGKAPIENPIETNVKPPLKPLLKTGSNPA